MGNKEKIYKKLSENSMTSSELSESLSIGLQSVKTYLLRLKSENKIEFFDKKGREYIYRIKNKSAENPKEVIELLIFLNEFFKDNIDHLLKNSKISKFILNHEEFDKVEEVIKRCQV